MYLQIPDVWFLQWFYEIEAKKAKRTQTESAINNQVISEQSKYQRASNNVWN